MKNINAYLMFDGGCAQAMQFYQKIFKAELQMSPYSDAPGMPIPPGAENRIMHARLEKGEAVLMASDIMPGMGSGPFTRGDGFQVSIACESKAEVDEFAKALQAGGEVRMPNQEMFWGAYFGMVTDQFGIEWMLNFDHPEA